MQIFHGGCHGCVNQALKGVGYCDGCMYRRPSNGLPNLFRSEDDLLELKKLYEQVFGNANKTSDSAKLEIAKEMCNKIIRHWEVDRIFVKDPFEECYQLAKETLSALSN